MNLDDELIYHLGRLARLRLTADEVEELRSDIQRLLEYVVALDEVDPGGALGPPEATGALEDLRPDCVIGGLTPDEAFQNAPLVIEDHFAVPAVILPDPNPAEAARGKGEGPAPEGRPEGTGK